MTDTTASDWPDQLTPIGHVLDAWGVRGWIKLAPASSDAAALLKARRWWLESAPGRPLLRRAVTVKLARRHGSAVVALLDGVEQRADADALKGCSVLALREDFPSPDAGEYYWVDLIGCTVRNRDGLALGQVSGLLDSGAQTTLQLRDDACDPPQQRLIPFVDAYIDSVDLQARCIRVDWQTDY